MSRLSIKWPMPMLLAAAGTAAAALFIALNVRFVDLMLDSTTSVFGVLCALIAIARLAHHPLTALGRVLWLCILAVAAIAACAEFAESFAELKGHNFSLENMDDVLLLAAGPFGLWLTVRISPRPTGAQFLLLVGLTAQLCGAVLDLEGGNAIPGLALHPQRTEYYADFAQFLSLLSYLLALWLLVTPSRMHQKTARFQSDAKRTALYGIGLRDTLYPPPFLLGLGVAGPHSPAGRVHRLCNKALWPESDVIHSARNLGTIALWPIIASARALPAVRHYGAAVQRLTGKTPLQQFLEQVSIAVRHRIAPAYYYMYELYRPAQLKQAPHYLMRYETKEIAYRLLYPMEVDEHHPSQLKNKLEFARHCRANGIRHTEVYMLFEDGKRIRADDLRDDLPMTDLFVKPVLGKGGSGCQVWRYVADGVYRNSRGEQRDSAALVKYVAELSQARPYLILQAVGNHHELLELSAGALCTVRMVTCRNEAGDFEVTSAAFRMSVNPASPVDNFHAGGVAAAVDVVTGTLGTATDLGNGPDFNWHDRHPFTRAQIASRRLPMWQETVDLAVRAHRAFPEYAVIGWDIGILEDGPCIIEGNRGPDVDIHQRTALAPIGIGRFGELLAYNLEHRHDAL
jgi:hypothetical protein